MTDNLPVLQDAPIEDVSYIEMENDYLLKFPHKIKPGRRGKKPSSMLLQGLEYQYMMQRWVEKEYNVPSIKVLAYALQNEKHLPKRLVPTLEEHDAKIEYRYRYFIEEERQKDGTIKKVEHIVGKKYDMRKKMKSWDGKYVKLKTRTGIGTVKFRVLRIKVAAIEVVKHAWKGKSLPQMYEFLFKFVDRTSSRPGTEPYEQYMRKWRDRLLEMNESELMQGLPKVDR